MIIRSYRRVFKVDRRLYRIDRWALPVPGGIPLRGLGYFALALLAVIILSHLPLLGLVLGALSPPLRYIILPLAVAVLGMQATPDGRLAHEFALSWLTLRLRPRRTCAGKRVPFEGAPVPWKGRVGIRHDADTPVLQRARVRGPAVVYFAAPMWFSLNWRGGWTARPNGATHDVTLEADDVLEVKP